jgi:tetratricopeptide (TPR) repeat protein
LPRATTVKDIFTSLLAGCSILVVVVGVVKAGLDDSIGIEPLLVPSGFSDRGYSPQIATIRLVDELKLINAMATTTKSRNTVTGKAPGEELAKLNSLPFPSGIDVHSIQMAVRDFLGVTNQAIGGDITFLGKPEEGRYHVRIRKAPGNLLLVDGVFIGEPDAVLKEVALKIIEKVDPVVAASYFRNKKNTKEALRCIDYALTNDNPADDVFALSQRAQIYLQQKKFELSKRDLDELLRIDPKSPQGLGVLSYWYNEQKMFPKGMEYAEKQMNAKPDMWHAYFNKADALMGMGLDAEAVILKGIQLKPNRPDAYIDAADYFSKTGKLSYAMDILKAGAGRFPASFDMNFRYGERLLKDGHKDLALNYLTKAQDLQPQNPSVLKSLAEAQAQVTVIK